MTKVDLYLSHLSKGQIIRITIGLVFLALVGMVYLPHLLFTMSVSAVINARTITLTTPIDGYLKDGPAMIGTELQKGERIAIIENPTVDRSTVEGLETDYNSLNERIKALYQEKETLLLLKSQLELSVKQYQDSTENRLSVDIKRAEARHQELINSVQENKRNLTRKDSLFKKGNIAASSLDNAYFATERSEKAAEQAKLELDRLISELHSIRQGVFINRDGRSEVPYQRQRIDEIKIRLSNVDTSIHEHKARLESLKKRLEFEQDRFKRQERHEMVAPNFSVIWRTFAMEGTHLNAKYPVLELLDCTNVYVDMTISERYFEKIKPGDRARIELTGSQEEVTGIVISVRGGSITPQAAQGSFAGITPIRRQREIQVLIKIDEQQLTQTKGDFCHVGRNGNVYFE